MIMPMEMWINELVNTSKFGIVKSEQEFIWAFLVGRLKKKNLYLPWYHCASDVGYLHGKIEMLPGISNAYFSEISEGDSSMVLSGKNRPDSIKIFKDDFDNEAQTMFPLRRNW